MPRSRKTKSVWSEQSRLEYVREKLEGCLQRGDVAAGLGLTETEFQGFIDGGCAPNAPKDLRELARVVVEAEITCKEGLIARIQSGKNWQGALELLRVRFKTSWGKEAKPPAEGISADVVDWDAELGAMLDDEYSPLVYFLESKGFKRSSSSAPPQVDDEAQNA